MGNGTATLENSCTLSLKNEIYTSCMTQQLHLSQRSENICAHKPVHNCS